MECCISETVYGYKVFPWAISLIHGCEKKQVSYPYTSQCVQAYYQANTAVLELPIHPWQAGKAGPGRALPKIVSTPSPRNVKIELFGAANKSCKTGSQTLKDSNQKLGCLYKTLIILGSQIGNVCLF